MEVAFLVTTLAYNTQCKIFGRVGVAGVPSVRKNSSHGHTRVALFVHCQDFCLLVTPSLHARFNIFLGSVGRHTGSFRFDCTPPCVGAYSNGLLVSITGNIATCSLVSLKCLVVIDITRDDCLPVERRTVNVVELLDSIVGNHTVVPATTVRGTCTEHEVQWQAEVITCTAQRLDRENHFRASIGSIRLEHVAPYAFVEIVYTQRFDFLESRERIGIVFLQEVSLTHVAVSRTLGRTTLVAGIQFCRELVGSFLHVGYHFGDTVIQSLARIHHVKIVGCYHDRLVIVRNTETLYGVSKEFQEVVVVHTTEELSLSHILCLLGCIHTAGGKNICIGCKLLNHVVGTSYTFINGC